MINTKGTKGTKKVQIGNKNFLIFLVPFVVNEF